MPIMTVLVPGDLGPEFDQGGSTPNKVTVVPATDTVAGKTKIVKAAAYPSISDVAAATPAYVSAAIAALPADKYLASVGAYDAATNKFTLNISDGSTVIADLTQLVADAIASVPNGSDTIAGIVSLAVAANMPSTSDTEAATPAYIDAKLGQPAALPVKLTNSFGTTTLGYIGNP